METYRKLSLGSQSPDGERRIARLLSAHSTRRLQRRSLYAYLIDLLGAPAVPQIVPRLGDLVLARGAEYLADMAATDADLVAGRTRP